MAAPATIPVAKTLGFGFKMWFKLALLFLVIFFVVFNAIIISIQAKSIEPGIKEVGSRMMQPTLRLKTESQKIIENQGTYVKTENFWGGVWGFIKTNGVLFLNLYIIWIWIKVFAWVIARSPISETSRWAINHILATFLFLFLQAVYLLIFVDPGEMTRLQLAETPITAFIDFGKALPHIISPIANIIGEGEFINVTENLTGNLSV